MFYVTRDDPIINNILQERLLRNLLRIKYRPAVCVMTYTGFSFEYPVRVNVVGNIGKQKGN